MLRQGMDVEDDDGALCSEDLFDNCQKQKIMMDNICIWRRIYMRRRCKRKKQASYRVIDA